MERLADRAILGRKSPPNGRGQIGPDAKTRVLPPRRQLSEIQEGDDDPGLTTVITDVERARDLYLYPSTEVHARRDRGAGLELVLWSPSFLLAWKAPPCGPFCS